MKTFVNGPKSPLLLGDGRYHIDARQLACEEFILKT